jgi:hypothetical protein
MKINTYHKKEKKKVLCPGIGDDVSEPGRIEELHGQLRTKVLEPIVLVSRVKRFGEFSPFG